MKLVLCLLLASSVSLLAQTATVRGVVTDQSGAVVPSARVTVTGASGTAEAISGTDGSYSVSGLTPGQYTVEASAPQLAMAQPVTISLASGVRTANLRLGVAATTQAVTVNEDAGPAVSTDPSGNAGAVVLRGTDLGALADDPDDLATDLQALAGPSAGPNGGQVFVDGFSGGQLPPKESIREIRINQNPFSPEYDTLGYGRVEVLTKPGTDKFRGTAFYNFGDSFWNSRNAYAEEKAPFRLQEYGGNLSGPMNARASFSLDIQRHAIDNGAIINGSVLDPVTLAIITPYTDVARIPQRRVIVTPRVDDQLNSKNTLTVRYNLTRADVPEAGIGSFNLASQAYHAHSNSQTVQLTETAALSTNVVNETRFQYFRLGSQMIADNPGPTLQVLGSFTGGGAPVGRSFDTQNNYELQNYTSIAHGKHSWRFGVRLRDATDDNTSPSNFGGTFTFGGGIAPQLNSANQPVLDPSGQPVMVTITSIESYRRTLLFEQMGVPAAQIRELGGGATQFSINAGIPFLSASQFDLGAFAGDDWRVLPNLTLSLGLRYETQTNIHDWRDFAPRFGLAWAIGSSRKSKPANVVRMGFGTFYDRFNLANTMTARRFNGVVQQQCVVTNPDFFPAVLPVASIPAQQSLCTIQKVDSGLRAPYTMQSTIALERQLPRNTTLSVTYANAHGLHLLRSQDINAPLPGTFNPDIRGSGVYPLGTPGPVFQMESSGLYNQNQFIVGINSRFSERISFSSAYVYNRSLSNTDGLGTFPADPYSMAGEYGPAATDYRHRGSLMGSFNTKWGILLSPLLTVNSGPPFDITVGRDLYGDTLFNDRPGIATDPSKPGLISTSYGLLDPNPTQGEKLVPRNFGRGPGSIMLNLRVTKAFAFGPPREKAAGNVPPGAGAQSGASSNHRYSLSISLAVRNLINHNNPGPIIGNITSPLFGQANQAAGAAIPVGTGFSEAANNRRLELQTRFTF